MVERGLEFTGELSNQEAFGDAILNEAVITKSVNKGVDVSTRIDNMSIHQPTHFRTYGDGFVPVKWDGVSYAGSLEAGVGKALGNTVMDLAGVGWEAPVNLIGSLATGNPDYQVMPRFEVKMDEQELAGYYGTIGLSFFLGGEASLLSKGSKVSSATKTTALTHYYPPNGGALGKWTSTTLTAGTRIDRFGLPTGKYFSPIGTPFNMRALPPGTYGAPTKYEIIKPFQVQSSTIAPWFGKPGLGKQYYSPIFNAQELIQGGFIKPIP
ncbi:TNT domain-containing protein [Moheibacter sediminis]|nr:TNT domain-containing protein [Moheibacter sediminis]